MKIFITASFKGGENKQEIEDLCSIVKETGFLDFCLLEILKIIKKHLMNLKN
ncbi:MAG: hypothetical protein ACOCXG_05580 [Nanoarchaeota archaeon]